VYLSQANNACISISQVTNTVLQTADTTQTLKLFLLNIHRTEKYLE